MSLLLGAYSIGVEQMLSSDLSLQSKKSTVTDEINVLQFQGDEGTGKDNQEKGKKEKDTTIDAEPDETQYAGIDEATAVARQAHAKLG